MASRTMYVFYFLRLRQSSSSLGAKCFAVKDTQDRGSTCIQAVNSGQESPLKTVLAFHLAKSAESAKSSNSYRTAPVRSGPETRPARNIWGRTRESARRQNAFRCVRRENTNQPSQAVGGVRRLWCPSQRAFRERNLCSLRTCRLFVPRQSGTSFSAPGEGSGKLATD